MKPLAAADIKGNWATVLLPIKADESIDWSRLESELDFILTIKPDGIYTNGTAGEFLTQTEAEFARLSRLVADKCEAHGINFQIGASHVSPQVTLTRARLAAKLNPGAIQVVLPDWVAVTNKEAIVFLQKIAEIIAPIGIILYNPPHAKRILSPSELVELKSNVPQLTGVKVMDGDADWYRKIKNHCRDLSVFVPGHRLASGFRQGADGSYSNVACLHPRAAQKWWELMQTNLPAAQIIEDELQSFFRDYITPLKTEQGFSAVALDKLLMAIGDWTDVGTRLRFPYRWFPEPEIMSYRAIARKVMPTLFGLISSEFSRQKIY